MKVGIKLKDKRNDCISEEIDMGNNLSLVL